MTDLRIDETTLSTVWYDMQQTCYDMRYAVERTAQNYLMAQLHDLSVGIWDGSGRMVAVPIGIAVHFLSGGRTIRSILSDFGKDIYPGDVFLTNDPYRGGDNCHLPDWAFCRPIFYEGELVFWTLVRGHQQDTGGAYPGGYFPGGYDVHSEGLCVPPVKVIERGAEVRDVLKLIWNNVRWADGVRIDNYSMIAATKLCEQRLTKLMSRYGKDVVLACVEKMIGRTDVAIGQCIEAIPDGTYYGEASTDDDGTELDVPVTVRCKTVVKGDKVTLDFSESDRQRKGFINGTYGSTAANGVAAVILCLNPELADFHNEGTLRHFEVIAPEGSVVNAMYPAPHVGSPVAVGIPVMEAVLQGMAQAQPKRAIAAAGRHRTVIIFGHDPRSDQEYMFFTFNTVGSLGAVNGYDGYTGAVILHSRGAITRGNVEEEEVRWPWRTLKCEFATDLMGAGKYTGGWGVHHEMIHEGTGAYFSTGTHDGDDVAVLGALGGSPAPPNRTYIRRGGQDIRAKSHRLFRLEPKDIVIHDSSGGGGVGDPAERDPEKVREDVLNEIVSHRAARDVYRVAINPERLTIDWEETKALRGAQA